MRIKLAFILLLFSIATIAQIERNTTSFAKVKESSKTVENANQEFNIVWSNPKNIYNSGKALDFVGAFHDENLPTYQILFKDEYVSKLSLKDEVYVALSEQEIKLLPDNFNQKRIKTTISYGMESKKWVSNVSFVPISNVEGVWQKLVSFNIEKEVSSAPQSRSGTYSWKDRSVFASGTWYKIGVTKTGIHKIDYNFVASLGVNPDIINPQNIRVYGNGGKMLPQLNSDTWYDDVDQNAIYVSGEGDGVFNTGDYALFYAQGPTHWSLDTSNSIFTHEKNLYFDTAYYFITFTFPGGKRIQSQPSESGSTITFTEFDDYLVHEIDQVNVMTSGRYWFGEKFDFELNRSFSFTTSGINSSNLGVRVTSSLASMSPASPTFQISLNNSNLGTENLKDSQYSTKYPTAKLVTTHWPPVNTSNNTLNVDLTFSKGGSSSSVGYCNYIALNFRRSLSLYGNQTYFRRAESINHAVSTYQISNASGATVWDVTDILNVKQQTTSGGGTLSFAQKSDILREFVVFTGSTFALPTYVEKLDYQNLHGLSTPDFVIITSSIFADEANRLAQHRRDNDNLEVHVVDVNRVFNEFSSGMQDVGAIRNFMKMFYDRSNGSKLKYLLLMGDASYDYKSSNSSNTNFVPVYESRNSIDPIKSHSSDDFYALLDDNEGVFCENNCDAFLELLDVGVGRIPAKTIEEAEAVISKIIYYDSEKSNIQACHSAQSHVSGKWRNEVVLIGDDADNNAHFNSAEKIYNTLQAYPDYHVKKIYIDAYEQISGAGGQSAPQVKAEINARMDRGALIFNYSGHGGELGLSHEGVISVPQINAWDNIDNMPLMFTATCEFGRYDDPNRTSAGELTLLNPNGGVVSIVTTTRPVYSSGNDQINTAFFGSVFEPLDVSTGEMPRLGDVMKNSKNGSQSTSSVNNRNFALLGDPSLQLSYPKENVVVTTINNSSVIDTIGDTLSALAKVTLEGEIRNANNVLISNFNGVLEASIYDKLNSYKTLGDEGTTPVDFEARDIKIFEGLASITDGKFKFSFIVPKDIKYTFGNGKALFYASSDNLKTNGNGSNSSFIVGGTGKNIAEDNIPPEISLFMDDETFVFGGTTSESPVFLAKLFDEHGINTTGVGIGHELSSVLDENVNNTIILNDFYTSELDEYQKGIVEYPLEELQPGLHKITLKAWDTYNNSNEKMLEFLVINEEDIALQHILNYPNPFTTNTEFHFDHNRACDDLEIRIQVFTVSGKLIKTINTHIPHANAHVSDIFWDGKDDYGDNIGRGVYVYKVKVRSLTDGSQVHDFQKLVILK